MQTCYDKTVLLVQLEKVNYCWHGFEITATPSWNGSEI